MPYYGKYRAKVVDLKDPEKRGRLRVECPSVLGEAKSNWCEPCISIAYDGGGDFCLPPLNETVWIEFEEGNQNKPIWVGSWWSKEKTPIENYDEADKERIVEYQGVKISMKEGILTVSAKEIHLND